MNSICNSTDSIFPIPSPQSFSLLFEASDLSVAQLVSRFEWYNVEVISILAFILAALYFGVLLAHAVVQFCRCMNWIATKVINSLYKVTSETLRILRITMWYFSLASVIAVFTELICASLVLIMGTVLEQFKIDSALAVETSLLALLMMMVWTCNTPAGKSTLTKMHKQLSDRELNF